MSTTTTRRVTSIAWDVVIIACIHAAYTQGNAGAVNVLRFLYAVCAIFLCIVMLSSTARDSMRKPGPVFSQMVDMTIGVAIAGLLAWHGAWLFCALQFIASIAVSSIQAEGENE